jgi:hypothetical protein
MLDGPIGNGYANLVHRTYRHSQDRARFPRFQAEGGRSRIIQCAEHLPDSRGILRTTYSNTCWQNGLLDEASAQADRPIRISFAHQLDPEFVGYPSEYANPATGEVLPVAPLQYFESHDHSRFINRFGATQLRDLLDQPYGDRGRFYKMQPYVIALYTCKGIPMLWHGQEFSENWSVPSGLGRVLLSRPLQWEYFYDTIGKAVVRLYRIMGTLRARHRALGSRGFFFYYDDPFHRRDGIVAYRRLAEADDGHRREDMIVILNFSDQELTPGFRGRWPGSGRSSSMRSIARGLPFGSSRTMSGNRCGFLRIMGPFISISSHLTILKRVDGETLISVTEPSVGSNTPYGLDDAKELNLGC